MASILDRITIGNIQVVVTDVDPTISGLDLPVGSIISVIDGSGVFNKTGTGITDYYKLINVKDLSALNILEVNKNPLNGQFATIETALSSITTNSATNPFVIKVDVGIYLENQLNCKPYVSIIGTSIQTTIIKPIGNHDLFVITDVFTELSFMSLQSVQSGKAAIFCNDSGNYSQAHKVNFIDCDINIKILSITQDTYFYGEYIDYNGTYTYGTKVNATNGFVSYANLENYYNLPTGGVSIGTYISGIKSNVDILTSGNIGTGSVGTAIYLENGANVTLASTYANGWATGLHVANIGVASNIEISSLTLTNDTNDILIEHSLTSGTFSGAADITKINNNSLLIGWNFLDNITKALEITNKLNISFPDGTHTDLSTLITKSSTMGLITGGLMTDGGGLNINIAQGFGYFEQFSDTEIIHDYLWNNTTLLLSSNQDVYVYINNNKTFTTNSSIPNTIYNILLGRVITNNTGIELIINTPLNAQHTSNNYDNLFRYAIGSIYVSGSIVTENVTPFHLNISNGTYFYSTTKIISSGFTNGTFSPILGGIIQTPTNIVNNTSYDVSGTLTSLSTGYYTKHSLYISGQGVTEKYYLVYATTQYATLLQAQQANIPTPPTFIRGAVTLIAGIIIQQGAGTISQIRDLRPVIGFKSEGINASADHLSLLNLTSGNAGHTQFMLLDGSTSMVGNLNMNTNNISNITTLNGILPSNWFKQGGQAFGVNTILGLTDAFNLSLRTNNIDRLLLRSTGEVSIQNLLGSGTKVIGVDNLGNLINTVTTSNLNEGTNLYYLNSRVISAPITGYVSGTGVVSTTDSILQAIQKLNGNISALVTGVSSISGTANRITSTGGANPVIDISASYVGQSSITTLGTVTTGIWNGTAIGATFGGTGQTIYAIGDILYADSTTTLTKRAIGTSGKILTVVGGIPTWLAPANAVTASNGLTKTGINVTLGGALTGATTINGTGNLTIAPTGNIDIQALGALASLSLSTVNGSVVSNNLSLSLTHSQELKIFNAGVNATVGIDIVPNSIDISTNNATTTDHYNITLQDGTGILIQSSTTTALNTFFIGTNGSIYSISDGSINNGYVIDDLIFSKGLTYTSVYDANFTANSLITKNFVQVTNNTLGTITTGVWSATAISAIKGGTGQTVYAIGDIIYASSTTVLSKRTIGISGQVLTVVGGIPTWATPTTGTVTSVSALTLGTTGTDLSSTVANSTTTPVITLNVPNASATNRGVLTSTDWTTFNSKQAGSTNLTSLSGLTFVSTSFVKMTATGVFSLDTNTYLTANQTITLSGEASGSGSTSISVTLSNSAVIGKLLTGYVSGAGTVAATDSILQAIQKLNGNVSALVTGVSSVNGSTGAVVVTTTGTINRITVTGGSSITPTVDIAATYVGQSSITTLGTITTGVWSGTAISNANLANSSVTIGSTSISLGSTSTTLIGLTSVTSTTFIGALTGNASTATTLQTARTINGVSFDGSANITVTSASGTLTGTTLNSTVVSSSLTSVGTITTGVWNGAAIIDTYISSATNWNTAYTNRITSLTTAGNSGAATLVSNVLNIPTHTLSGLGGQPLATNLTSLSGLTFVSTSFVKMSSIGTFILDTNTYLTGNQIITLSGDVTGSGTTSIAVTLSNSAVIGKLLTGYISGAGTISATDSILQAIQKLNGNISTLVTGVSSVSGTANRITSTGGANPIIDISASYIGQSSITTLGTIATGTWNGTPITDTYLASTFIKDNGSIRLAYVSKTDNYTITINDYTINCTLNTFTVTLPTAVGIIGKIYNIKNSGTGTITLATMSSELIDNVSSWTLLPTSNGTIKPCITVQSTNIGWIII